MKRLLFGELLLVLITIVFIYIKPISRIYVAEYLEKISLFLFRTVSDKDLNEWDEKRDKYLFPHVFLYLRLAQRTFYAYKEPLNVAKTVLTCD